MTVEPRIPAPGSATAWAGRAVANARLWLAARTAWPAPCARCRKPVHRHAWHLGHRLDRQAHPELTWHRDNWQVEHPSCSSSAGAAQGNRRRGRRRPSSQQVSFLDPGRAAGPACPSVSLPTPRTETAVPSWPSWWPEPPDDQVLPRLLTAPHPRAVGSYGPELEAWAAARFGMHPKVTTAQRWWQRLLYAAALQHDDQGDLLMANVLLGTARQVGKSWALREVCMWRIEQAARWGELQTVVHAAAKLSQAEAVWKPAALWAARQPSATAWKTPAAAQEGLWAIPGAPGGTGGHPSPQEGPSGPRIGGYEVRRANGSAALLRPDGSSWIPQAANDQLGVSLSVPLAIVDEAWDVPRWIVDNGLAPTQAEARSPQLWLVSTAGRPKSGEISDLYPHYRAMALAELDAPDSTLIVEWSAPADADPGDPATWRAASPHWDDRRAQLLEREWRKAQASDDALAAFRMQWLNQWPTQVVASTSRLVASATWQALADPGAAEGLPWSACGVEASFGCSPVVARAAQLGDGRVMVSVVQAESMAAAAALAAAVPGPRFVGKSLTHDPVWGNLGAEARGSTSAAGVAEMWQLLEDRVIVHDGGAALSAQVEACEVERGLAGPKLLSSGRVDAIKAAVWAVSAARASQWFAA